MSDHVTPESAFFAAEEKVQILSGKCPGITKGRLKVILERNCKRRKCFIRWYKSRTASKVTCPWPRC